MKYFTAIGEDGYECIQFLRDEDLQLMMSLDGRPLLPSWVPPRVRTGPADETSSSKRSDFPSFASWVVITRSLARETLAGLCNESGEWLPMYTIDGESLFALNVTRVIDAIDRGNSDIVYFPGTSKIMIVRRASFHSGLLEGVDVFRLPGVAADVYVSERVARAVKSAKLNGVRFREV